jgi:hypothetical protein
MRPDWWPTWVPQRCAEGHLLEIGTVSQSWMHCDCPASGDAQGHHNWFCTVWDCKAEQIKPPGCDRTLEQR